jgi:hypothetical protein
VGVVRTVEWSLSAPPEEAKRRIRQALSSAGMEPEGDGSTIHATSDRSLRKNRWAAEISVDLAPLGEGTLATVRVEMNGDKHYEVLHDIAEAVGDDAFEDRGDQEGIEESGKASGKSDRDEVGHLRHLVRAGENIVAFGQGTYEGKQGIVALTDHRLFFYRGSFRESVEEFGLGSIRSLEVGKDTTGERLVIHASGDRAEITQMRPGQADELTRAFRALELRPSDPADARDLIRMLDELRDAGVLTAEEFDAKKAALLDRL